MEEVANYTPFYVFISSFLVAAFACLATLLRSDQHLSTLKVISALLNGGFLGLGISLVWYTKFQDNLFFLVGVCVLAGLGGMTTLDFILKSIRGGGFKISFTEGLKFGGNDDDKKS